MNITFGAVLENSFVHDVCYHRAGLKYNYIFLKKKAYYTIFPNVLSLCVVMFKENAWNSDKDMISYFQIKVEKYLTPQEREKAEMLTRLEMERHLASLVFTVASFLLNRALSLICLM